MGENLCLFYETGNELILGCVFFSVCLCSMITIRAHCRCS